MVTLAAHSNLYRRTHSAPAERGTLAETGYSMSRPTQFAAPAAIAAVTLAACAFALAPAADAAPAETCLGAPKGAAPQGSHWYYRFERPSQRKCWYLAEKGRAVAKRATPQAPRAEPDADRDAPAASIANAPAIAAAPAPASEQVKPVITTLTTRNVSNETAPGPDATQPPTVRESGLNPAAVRDAAPTAAVSAIEPSASDAQAPAASEQPPAAAVVAEPVSAAAATMSSLEWLLAGIALVGFLASAVSFVMAMLRRRRDVLDVTRERDALPFQASPETTPDDTPPFPRVPALDPIRQHDEVDEILQRLARRRRAA
jgi:hypothetical protein